MSMISEFVEKLIERLDELRKIERDREDYRDNHDYYEDWEEAFEDGESNGKHYAYAKAIEIIKQFEKEYVPDINVGNSSENLTSWIPYEEKLPEYNPLSEYYESVIVTLDDGRVVDGCYRNKDKEWWVDDEDGEHYSINATGHVIAWMPLPEPFKEK